MLNHWGIGQKLGACLIVDLGEQAPSRCVDESHTAKINPEFPRPESRSQILPCSIELGNVRSGNPSLNLEGQGFVLFLLYRDFQGNSFLLSLTIYYLQRESQSFSFWRE